MPHYTEKRIQDYNEAFPNTMRALFGHKTMVVATVRNLSRNSLFFHRTTMVVTLQSDSGIFNNASCLMSCCLDKGGG